MAAMCLIKKADPQRFYNLWNELYNGTIFGESTDMYPKTAAKAYGMFCKYKKTKKITRLTHNRVDVIFHQKGYGKQTSPPISGTDTILHRDVMCYNCDRTSHYSGNVSLPDCRKTGTQSLQLGYSFAQTNSVQKYMINPNSILLDYCSITSSIMNPYILS